MTQMESELFKGTAKEFMKSYKDGGMVYLDSYEKDEIIEEMKRQKEEIERLNNIINELEKWLKEEMKDKITDIYVEYQFILNKIKKLKGSDKE